jgi:hypothetical protein
MKKVIINLTHLNFRPMASDHSNIMSPILTVETQTQTRSVVPRLIVRSRILGIFLEEKRRELDERQSERGDMNVARRNGKGRENDGKHAEREKNIGASIRERERKIFAC